MPKQTSFLIYVLKRLLFFFPTILMVIIINFVLIHLAPGDPAIFLAGQTTDPAFVERLRVEFGLNRPLHEQLLTYILKVLSGDLGYSYVYGTPVLNLVMSKLPYTLMLTGTALAIAALVGTIMGAYAASKVYSITDNTVTIISLLGYSLPVFWLGQILVLVFSLYLGLFPAQGLIDLRTTLVGFDYLTSLLRHLFLPLLTLSVWQLGLVTRLTRASMLEVLEQDYIVTAKSKGVSERTVIYKHALRNALLPVVTVVGMEAGLTFMGAALTETVFAWPGVGRLMFDSILARDYPVLLGVFIIVSIMVILSTLITDIIYAFLDPRIRYR